MVQLLSERTLRSRKLRGLVRIHVGGSLVRSHYLDTRVPDGTSAHLFDILLYRREAPEESFTEWREHRELR